MQGYGEDWIIDHCELYVINLVMTAGSNAEVNLSTFIYRMVWGGERGKGGVVIRLNKLCFAEDCASIVRTNADLKARNVDLFWWNE